MKKVILFAIFLAAAAIFALPAVADAQYYQNCSYHSYQQCSGGFLYWYDSCGNRQDYIGNCDNHNYNYNQNYNPNYGNCTSHSYWQCTGNAMYWYDSCGNRQDLIQYCQNGCFANSCNPSSNNYNYNYQSNCTYHAYRQCEGNNIYWYDSCGNRQDIIQTCSGGLTCQYGQCATYIPPVPIQPRPPYVAHYRTACYGISLYWYDSLGVFSGLNKSCADTNSCTLDTCTGNKCVNTLKCDGSTCATGSADYTTHCATQQPPAQPTANLSISFVAKTDPASTQWQKIVELASSGTVYFMVAASNNSSSQIDSVNISANIPTEISSLGNVRVNDIPVAGDIVTGINVGSIAASTTKTVTFEGKTQTISTASTKQAEAKSGAKTDSLSISFKPGENPASVSDAPTASGFVEFIKRWYLWILGGVILVALFIIVFRRFSSEA